MSELLESFYNCLIANKVIEGMYKPIQELDIKYFDESGKIIQIMQNKKQDQNVIIGATLVLKCYLRSLNHEEKITKFSSLYMHYLIEQNNHNLSEIFKVLQQLKVEEFDSEHKNVQALIMVYEVFHTFVELMH